MIDWKWNFHDWSWWWEPRRWKQWMCPAGSCMQLGRLVITSGRTAGGWPLSPWQNRPAVKLFLLRLGLSIHRALEDLETAASMISAQLFLIPYLKLAELLKNNGVTSFAVTLLWNKSLITVAHILCCFSYTVTKLLFLQFKSLLLSTGGW